MNLASFMFAILAIQPVKFKTSKKITISVFQLLDVDLLVSQPPCQVLTVFTATLHDVVLSSFGDDSTRPRSPSVSASVCGRCLGIWNVAERVCVDILYDVWV